MPAQKQSLQYEGSGPAHHGAGVDIFDRFILAIAREITHSREEAEAAACEILHDIERFVREDDPPRSRAECLEALIAWRKLLDRGESPGH
jgi:hypothetical protein